MKTLRLSALLLALVLLAACGGPTPAPAIEPTAPPAAADGATAEPTATAPVATATLPPSPEPTAANTPAPTAEPDPAASVAAVDWAAVESETADGFFVRGNPDAPILIRDYSDFL